MNIPVNKLLAKIEEELKLAKGSAKEENLRERVYSIKILCELILDEKPAIQTMAATSFKPVVTPPVVGQPVSLNQPKKLVMDDEANGDSLFDF